MLQASDSSMMLSDDLLHPEIVSVIFVQGTDTVQEESGDSYWFIFLQDAKRYCQALLVVIITVLNNKHHLPFSPVIVNDLDESSYSQ